ncbi:hypothetical protein BJ508DRAFT_15540 [Ascobolus immersus RN42]|uniref:Uncharacterized protein n=1 Tax=Ascobolus immersus RN42 TaxID=1160509 RepID=A0A3N4HPZ4_ASCIM|nr:hypothetical protein BJ508DRAFT_15540 [Ascobolus immersus RN42]
MKMIEYSTVTQPSLHIHLPPNRQFMKCLKAIDELNLGPCTLLSLFRPCFLRIDISLRFPLFSDLVQFLCSLASLALLGLLLSGSNTKAPESLALCCLISLQETCIEPHRIHFFSSSISIYTSTTSASHIDQTSISTAQLRTSTPHDVSYRASPYSPTSHSYSASPLHDLPNPKMPREIFHQRLLSWVHIAAFRVLHARLQGC